MINSNYYGLVCSISVLLFQSLDTLAHLSASLIVLLSSVTIVAHVYDTSFQLAVNYIVEIIS